MSEKSLEQLIGNKPFVPDFSVCRICGGAGKIDDRICSICAPLLDGYKNFIIVLDENRKPRDAKNLEEFFAFHDNPSRKVVKHEMAGRYDIRTDFVGYNMAHNRAAGVPALWFETMIDLRINAGRYTTWEEAEAGHARVVAQCKREQKFRE